MGLIGGVYQPWLFSPLLFLEQGLLSGPPWGEGFLQVLFFYLVAIALSAALPTISIGGAIGLLTLPMSEEHRGILAFFRDA
jgi:hypothetical protein